MFAWIAAYFDGMTAAQKIFFLGQVFGWINVTISLTTYVSTKRSRILLLKLTSDIFNAFNMALCNFRVAGAVTSVVCIGRETVFYNRTRHKWADHRFWLFLFMGLMMTAPLIDFWVRGSFLWLSLLPTVGSLVAAVGLFIKSTMRTKILVFFAQFPYLVYNMLAVTEESAGAVVFSPNMPGLIGTAIPMISSVVGIANEFIQRSRMQKAAAAENAGLQTDGKADKAEAESPEGETKEA